MKKLKRIAVAVFLCIEGSVFAYFAYYGTHSIRDIAAQRKQYAQLLNDNELLRKEVEELQHEIDDWKLHPFYREQYAREHLQMARSQDEIYVV